MKTKLTEATREEYTAFKVKYGYAPLVIRYLTFKPKVKTTQDIINEVAWNK